MRVLVVEDHKLIGDAVQASLRQAGFTVDWVCDGVAADAALNAEQFSAVVLDIGLPRRSGLALLHDMRNARNMVPVIILTARDTVEDRIAGLDAGADDYLVKPFDMGELAARLRALIRRGARGAASPVMRVGGLTLDTASHQVMLEGREVELSSREFALLNALMLNAGRVLSRAQLEQHLYAWGDEVESNAVVVHIHNLRRKLGNDTIRNIRGVGYLIPRETDA